MNACIYEIIRRGGGRLLMAMLGMLSLTGMASADVKIVATVNVTGQPSPPDLPPDAPKPPRFPQTLTTYYQGSRVRVEVAGGPVTITDIAAGKVYGIDSTWKTFWARPLRHRGERGGGPPMDGKMLLKASGNVKRIAGQAAQEYAVSETFGHPFGGPGGERPFGGPGEPPPGPPPGFGPPHPRLSGEIWLSDALPLTGDGLLSAMTTARQMVGRGSPEAMLIAEALEGKKRLPLACRIVFSNPPPPPWSDGGGNAWQSPRIRATWKVLSVSQASLPAALFQPPPGYTQVPPPLPRFGPPEGGRPPHSGGRFGPPPPGDWP